MKFLVVGSEGPGFEDPEDTVEILENTVLPGLARLVELEESKKILGGGIPVGDRASVFIIEVDSNEELDLILRDLPMWGVLEWDVTPLQSFAGRAAKEREVVEQLRKMLE
jgi:muconolactone delta-isomerase